MSPEALLERLAGGEVIALPEREWTALAPSFETVEDHPTGVAGRLLVLRRGRRWLAVEQPDPGRRAVRGLTGREAARSFVQDRLAAYDRIWDG